MPMQDGYTIYVAPHRSHPSGGPWIVRAYRDADDRHIHSAEGGVPLTVGLREAQAAIERDLGELMDGRALARADRAEALAANRDQS